MSFGPFFRSPFTDLTGCLINSQQYERCATMEMDLVDCVEAYGTLRATEKCGKLLSDFEECIYGRKQMLRFEAMRLERHKQYYLGDRKEHFAPPPVIDSY